MLALTRARMDFYPLSTTCSYMKQNRIHVLYKQIDQPRPPLVPAERDPPRKLTSESYDFPQAMRRPRSKPTSRWAFRSALQRCDALSSRAGLPVE
ncbi:hypothetical protein VTK26DRAFT_5056 [Humicola hyalothermophila]